MTASSDKRCLFFRESYFCDYNRFQTFYSFSHTLYLCRQNFFCERSEILKRDIVYHQILQYLTNFEVIILRINIHNNRRLFCCSHPCILFYEWNHCYKIFVAIQLGAYRAKYLIEECYFVYRLVFQLYYCSLTIIVGNILLNLTKMVYFEKVLQIFWLWKRKWYCLINNEHLI